MKSSSACGVALPACRCIRCVSTSRCVGHTQRQYRTSRSRRIAHAQHQYRTAHSRFIGRLGTCDTGVSPTRDASENRKKTCKADLAALNPTENSHAHTPKQYRLTLCWHGRESGRRHPSHNSRQRVDPQRHFVLVAVQHLVGRAREDDATQGGDFELRETLFGHLLLGVVERLVDVEALRRDRLARHWRAREDEALDVHRAQQHVGDRHARDAVPDVVFPVQHVQPRHEPFCDGLSSGLEARLVEVWPQLDEPVHKAARRGVPLLHAHASPERLPDVRSVRHLVNGIWHSNAQSQFRTSHSKCGVVELT
eukprot:2440624-Rhodomonas_salina.1